MALWGLVQLTQAGSTLRLLPLLVLCSVLRSAPGGDHCECVVLLSLPTVVTWTHSHSLSLSVIKLDTSTTDGSKRSLLPARLRYCR